MKNGLVVLFSILLSLSFLIIPSVFATVDTTGSTSSLDHSSNVAQATQINASSSGNLISIGLYTAKDGNNLRVAIYANDSGNVGSLIAQSASYIPTVAGGWVDVSMPNETVITQNTIYWIAFQLSSDISDQFYYGTVNNLGYSFDGTQTNFNNGFNTTWTQTYLRYAGQLYMRMTYETLPIDNILTDLSCSPNPAEVTTDTVTCIGIKTNATDDTDVAYSLWQNETDLLNSSLGIDILSDLYYINPFTFDGIFTIRFNSSAGINYNVNDTGLTYEQTVTTTTTTITPMENILIALSCIPNQTNNVTPVYCVGNWTESENDTDVQYYLWSNDSSFEQPIAWNDGGGVENYLEYLNPFNVGIWQVIFNSSSGENYTANDTGLSLGITITTTTTTTPTIPECLGINVTDCFSIENQTTCSDYYAYDAYYSQCEWHEANGEPAGCYISGNECSVAAPAIPSYCFFGNMMVGFFIIILGLVVVYMCYRKVVESKTNKEIILIVLFAILAVILLGSVFASVSFC